MIRVPVNPNLLVWARERASLTQADLEGKFSKIGAWEGGEVQPTLKQVEAFASAVHVPVGYLFLSEPPSVVVDHFSACALTFDKRIRESIVESRALAAQRDALLPRLVFGEVGFMGDLCSRLI